MAKKQSNTSENYETVVDYKKLKKNYSDYCNRQIKDPIGTRNFKTVLHCGATLLTGGLYLLGFYGVHLLRFYQYSAEKGHHTKRLVLEGNEVHKVEDENNESEKRTEREDKA